MPRKSYTPKNRYWVRSKLNEFELVRLIWMWLAGANPEVISGHFHEQDNGFQNACRLLRGQSAKDGWHFPEAQPLRSISRQTVAKYIDAISDHLFWDVFDYPENAGEIYDNWTQRLKQISERVGEKRTTKITVRFARFFLKDLEGTRLDNLPKQIAGLTTFNDTFDEDDLMKTYTVFRYWMLLSDRQEYRFQRKLGVDAIEKSTGEAVRSFGNALFKKSHGLALKDAKAHCFRLGVLETLIRRMADLEADQKSNYIQFQKINDILVRDLTKVSALNSTGGCEFLLQKLGASPIGKISQ